MALGANTSSVVRMVLTGGMTPALAGVGLGLVGALALSRTVSMLLYETSPIDPVIYVGVSLLLTLTLLACLIPARSAARFDPMTALRGQE